MAVYIKKTGRDIFFQFCGCEEHSWIHKLILFILSVTA